MSVKLADTLAPMAQFPVAEAKDVDINIDGTHKDLQTAYEDGDLGGGQTIQVDTMPSASAEYVGQILEYVGASGTYTNGYFYECVSDGEATPTYSWVQKNVQPSNATASDVSYDNTISELDATNVQDAIDEVVSGLGTASGKDFTDEVRPNSHDLVESIAVYSAINNALNTIYTPRGDLSCSQLTSALLIADNVGNVYQMSDTGYTSSLFINGAGIAINKDDNVGIIKAGANEIMFNYMGSAFDLHDYQKKDLTTAVEGQTTVEGALGLLEYKSGTFPGTLAEWNALPASEKAKYDFLATPEEETIEELHNEVYTLLSTSLTTTATEYTLILDRKLSDYDYLIFQQYDATSMRNSMTIHLNQFKNKRVILSALHGTNTSSAADYSISGINVQYIDDTTVNAYTTGSGAINILEVIGIKIAK